MSFMLFGLANATTPDVMSIVKQMKDMMEPKQPIKQKWTITVMGDNGEKNVWTVGKLYKPLKSGKGIVIVMLKPGIMAGLASLVIETENKSRMWEYIPSVRRVREFPPVSTYEPFFGTDFAFADLGFVDINRDYELIGEEQHSGVKAYKVSESFGPGDRLYKRIVTWISAESLLPIESDYYDIGGVFKTELFKDVAVVDGVPTPMRIEMKAMDGRSTTIDVESINDKTDIPDEVFDPKNLSKLGGSHPVWQPFEQKSGEGK